MISAIEFSFLKVYNLLKVVKDTNRKFYGGNSMITVVDKIFDGERALYGSRSVKIKNCRFDGPADGESALKESADIAVENSYFNLRYPFWHDKTVDISDCEMTPMCRAALWYSENVRIERTKLHGIKALRECADVSLLDCDIISPEFGWNCGKVAMENCTAESEYFMMRSAGLDFRNVNMKGKYSFQYIKDALFENCVFDTKDAFWHAENVVVRNCTVKGEYLAWYCKNVTFENCSISGTQPFCYCKGLRLINCGMTDTDLAFERSDAEAYITTPVISIKNPYSGVISVPSAGEIIRDDENAKGEVIIRDTASENTDAAG